MGNYFKMLFQSLYLILGSVTLVFGSCGDIFSTNGLNSSSFAAGVAHGLHSLSLEELRYYFDEDSPEDNNIPTVNINLKDEGAVLDHVPLRGFEDRFDTWALKIMDWYMINNNNNIFQKGLNLLEKIIHQYHMHEVFQLASVIYNDLIDNPPSEDLCSCVTDDEFNGVPEELANIANQLRQNPKPSKSKGALRYKDKQVDCFRYPGNYNACPLQSFRYNPPSFSYGGGSGGGGGGGGGTRPRPLRSTGGGSDTGDGEIGNFGNNFAALQQEYLNNSTRETAFNLISLGKWKPGTLKGKKRWINFAAMLTFSMLTEEEIENFAIFIYCKLEA